MKKPNLFKSKAEKERERRMAVNKAMNQLERRIKKLEDQEQVYINAAKVAMREALPEQIELAKKALKLTIGEKKRTFAMLVNLRIVSQMKEMSAMTTDFVHALGDIGKSIAANTTEDMSKFVNEIQEAMEKVTAQTEEVIEVLESNQNEVGVFADKISNVDDTEIDNKIYGKSQSGMSNDEIEKKLASLREEINK